MKSKEAGDLFENETPQFIRLTRHLLPYLSSAVDTGVIIFFSTGQDKQQPFPDRHRLPALRAIKFRCVKILKRFFLPVISICDLFKHGVHREFFFA